MSSSGEPPIDWPLQIHRALSAGGVSLVAYVPDAGHKRLIELCHADPGMHVLPLTSEEEGIGLAAGAWLGSARCVLLMQSSGVGKLMNALGMAQECRFPLVLLVTMRGEEGETNPWQVPVGRAASALLSAMGVQAVRADGPEDVGPRVEEALRGAFVREAMTAVLVAQKVVGVKHFETEGSR